MNDTDELLALANIGIQAKQFLDSNLGKYIHGCAEQEKQEAMEAFINMDSTDPSQVRKVQLKAAVANQVIDWLEEAIDTGRQAEKQLEEEPI